jgi:phosphoribosylformylglycinamidine synthase subunit PurL
MATAAGAISIRAWARCTPSPKLRAKWLVPEQLRSAPPTASTLAIPRKPHIMWQFSQVIDGITKACEELDTPITGGNVSFYNETLGEGIYPTPVIGVVGILEDVHKTAKMHFAQAGRKLFCCARIEPGDAVDAEAEFGSSEYAKEILGAVWGYPPELDLEKEATLQRALVAMIQAGWSSPRTIAPMAAGRCAGGVGVAGRSGP